MSRELDWDVQGREWPHRECSRFVQVGRIRWHLQRMGSIEPGDKTAGDQEVGDRRKQRILLLHGTGSSTHSWRHLLPLLAGLGGTTAMPTDVCAVDLPGHAFTSGAQRQDLSLQGMAQALLGLLAQLRWEPTVVIGHSAGAAIAVAMHLASQAQAQVVSLNGALMPWGGLAGALFMPLAKALAATRLSAELFALNARRGDAVSRLMAQTGSRIDEADLRCYQVLATHPQHVENVLKMMAQWDLESLHQRLAQVRTPVKLIATAHDRTVPPRVSAMAARLIPGAALINVPQWGHLAHEEAPLEISREIARALGQA